MTDRPTPARRRLELEVVPGRLAVCRLPPDASLVEPPGGSWLWSATRTPDELSLVVPEGDAPEGARVESGFRALRVRGALEFQLTGILSDLAGALADAGVSLFAVSTYDTDWLLVRESALDGARRALESRGHRVLG